MNTQDRVRGFAQETARFTAGQWLGGSDGMGKFAEPYAWALEWDGTALSEIQEQQNEHTPTPSKPPEVKV